MYAIKQNPESKGSGFLSTENPAIVAGFSKG